MPERNPKNINESFQVDSVIKSKSNNSNSQINPPPVPPSKFQMKTCLNCGTVVRENSEFCEYCGAYYKKKS